MLNDMPRNTSAGDQKQRGLASGVLCLEMSGAYERPIKVALDTKGLRIAILLRVTVILERIGIHRFGFMLNAKASE